MKYKCPWLCKIRLKAITFWQIPVIALNMLKFKSKSNAKVTVSNDFYHYRGNVKAIYQLCTRFKLSKRVSKTIFKVQRLGTQVTRSNQLAPMGKSCHKKTLKWNNEVLAHTIQKISPMLKFSISRSNTKVKVTRSNL